MAVIGYTIKNDFVENDFSLQMTFAPMPFKDMVNDETGRNSARFFWFPQSSAIPQIKIILYIIFILCDI